MSGFSVNGKTKETLIIRPYKVNFMDNHSMHLTGL